MERLIIFALFIVAGVIWRLVKAGSKAAYRKVTEPSDSLKKTERESSYVAKDYGMTNSAADEYRNVQMLGVCFSRLALLVGYSDGDLDVTEYSSILAFFSGASSSYINHIADTIKRDLRNPQSIDWDYNMRSLRTLLRTEQFAGFDTVIFDGLLRISAADNKIAEEELASISKIMLDIGWTESKVESYYKSRFGYFRDESEDENERLRNAYQILNLTPGVSETEIRTRFRELAKQHHPDKFAIMGEAAQKTATERFQTLHDAYELLLVQLAREPRNSSIRPTQHHRSTQSSTGFRTNQRPSYRAKGADRRETQSSPSTPNDYSSPKKSGRELAIAVTVVLLCVFLFGFWHLVIKGDDVPKANPTTVSRRESSYAGGNVTIRYVASQGLYLRQSGSEHAKIIRVLTRGDRLFIQGEINGWLRVVNSSYLPKELGWVGAFYTSASRPAAR